MNLDKAIKERHSVRRFSSKKPRWEDIVEAIDAANSCPLAGNIPALYFLLIDDEEKIEKIAEASQQDFIKKAQYLVVVCSEPLLLVKSYEERGELYARQQAGAAIENFLLKITDLGLASCWVGEFVEKIVKRALVIPDNILVEAILPVGYEMPPRTTQKRKPALDRVLFFNKWKQKTMKPMQKPEAV